MRRKDCSKGTCSGRLEYIVVDTEFNNNNTLIMMRVFGPGYRLENFATMMGFFGFGASNFAHLSGKDWIDRGVTLSRVIQLILAQGFRFHEAFPKYKTNENQSHIWFIGEGEQA